MNIKQKEFKSLCAEKNLDKIRDFIKTYQDELTDIQSIMNEGFMISCYPGHLETIKYLLTSPEVKVKPDIHYEKDVALAIACGYNYIEIVKYLLTSSDLKEHANLHADNNRAFVWACEFGHVEIIDYLLHSKDLKIHANMNDISETKQLAFLAACSEGKLDVLKYLKSQPQLDIKLINKHINGDGKNIFQLACENMTKDTEIVEFLLIDYKYKPKKRDISYIQNNQDKELVSYAQDIINIMNTKNTLEKELSTKSEKVVRIKI